MKERFTVKIAGLLLEMEASSEVRALFGEYECEFAESTDRGSGRGIEVPDLTVDPKPWKEEVKSEFFAFSVALGDSLPLYRRLQTHGVAISYEGKSYIFTAPSGTGKSTRAFIWQKYLGEDKVSIINGDKPILWFKDDEVLSCGSPWCGKEGLQKNVCLPLGGICLLKRSSENRIRRAGGDEYFDFFFSQVQIPRDTAAKITALGLIEELYSKVPVYVLENDMSEEGFKAGYEALTGKEWQIKEQ